MTPAIEGWATWRIAPGPTRSERRRPPCPHPRLRFTEFLRIAALRPPESRGRSPWRCGSGSGGSGSTGSHGDRAARSYLIRSALWYAAICSPRATRCPFLTTEGPARPSRNGSKDIHHREHREELIRYICLRHNPLRLDVIKSCAASKILGVSRTEIPKKSKVQASQRVPYGDSAFLMARRLGAAIPVRSDSVGHPGRRLLRVA